MTLEHQRIRNWVLSAMFLALGIVLPFLTLQVPAIGARLCPMHLPVLLAGFVCGWPYAMVIGFVLPLLRSTIFAAPPLLPIAAAMAFELAAYGFFSGFLYEKLKNKRVAIYPSLIGAMVLGRVVWGVASYVIYHAMGNHFTWKIFAMQGVVNAVPGILLQLIVIPPIVAGLKAANVLGDQHE